MGNAVSTTDRLYTSQLLVLHVKYDHDKKFTWTLDIDLQIGK